MKIKKIKDQGQFIYPATIANAVKDLNFLKENNSPMTQGEINLYLQNTLLANVKMLPVSAYIDLGLPSGTLWAPYNLGALTQEDAGLYFAWGESDYKDSYNWPTYLTHSYGGAYNRLTKYCNSGGYGYNGFVDNKLTLELEDDVANQVFGTGWHIPSEEEFQELFTKCTLERTSINGVNGLKITGPNGNNIFLPAGGYQDGTNKNNVNNQLYYWINVIKTDMASRAYYFDYNGKNNTGLGRCFGLNIRPVFTPYLEKAINPKMLQPIFNSMEKEGSITSVKKVNQLINSALKNVISRIEALETSTNK